MSIKLKFEGFEDILNDIAKANGSINAATRECMVKSADIMDKELKTQMQAAFVDSDLIAAMQPPEVESKANRVTARVGYKKGAYDPHNLSNGYKVVFLNYGTPNRTEHGKVRARGFIQKAKNHAKRAIKDEQEKTLKEILKGLKQ